MDCGPDQTAGSRNREKPTEARGAEDGPGCCERGSMKTSAINIILTSQRVGPGSQEWHSIQISQVHSTLVVQRAGPGAQRGEAYKPLQCTQISWHRVWVQRTKTSAHKPQT